MVDVRRNMFDLSGRTALVTGGGYGLGRALVHGLAGHGARVGTTGVTVNTLSPGMITWSVPTEEGAVVRARNTDHTPVGRNRTAEDFVRAVVFSSAEGSCGRRWMEHLVTIPMESVPE